MPAIDTGLGSGVDDGTAKTTESKLHSGMNE